MSNKLREVGQDFAVDINKTSTEQDESPEEQKEIPERSTTGGKLILEWDDCTDLFGFLGVQEEHADLLHKAGIASLSELALCNTENLHEKMVTVNEQKKIVRRLPERGEVGDWIVRARQLVPRGSGTGLSTEHPHVVHGANKRPTVHGTRILVQTIVGYYKLGYSIEEILDGLPHLTPAQVYDALSYYHDHQAEIESDIATSEDMEELSAQYGLRPNAQGRVTSNVEPK